MRYCLKFFLPVGVSTMLPFPSRWRTRSVVYHPLEQGKSEEESATGPSPPASVQCLFDHSSSNVWAVTAGVFMAMTVVLGCLLYTQSVAIGSGHNYEHGFSTELGTSALFPGMSVPSRSKKPTVEEIGLRESYSCRKVCHRNRRG